MDGTSRATDGSRLAQDAPPTSAPRIIALLNQKGGVGKTTSTVNLGAALARDGKRVLLVDLDPQGHLTLHLGIDADSITHSVYDLLIDPEVTADEAILNARECLDAILAETDLAAAESELAGHADRQSILRAKLAPILDRYDYVLIDCPPSLGLLTLNALALAQEVFVPMQAHFLALQGVGKLLETVALVCRSVNPSLQVSGIILCMHEHQTTLAREIVADLEAFFTEASKQDVPWRHCRVLHPPVRRNIKLAEAPSFGQTIFDYAPWCPGALDYAKLARNVIEGERSRANSSNAAVAPCCDLSEHDAEPHEPEESSSAISSSRLTEVKPPQSAALRERSEDAGGSDDALPHEASAPSADRSRTHIQ